eukprot:maker-scaffold_6-snap-gene-6.12-mRNA-1 protein AED:0.00 eAED:0.00 QI:77/1/1/1/1/1/2/158/408
MLETTKANNEATMQKKGVQVDKIKAVEHKEVPKKSINKGLVACILVVAATVVGIVAGTVASSSSSDSNSNDNVFEEINGYVEIICQNIQENRKVRVNSTDYIAIVFAERPTFDDCVAFVSAASRLSSAVGDTVSDLGVTDEDLTLEDFCGTETANPITVFSAGENLSGLTIGVLIAPEDGPGGTLAAAGPCVFNVDTELPVIGEMTFDSADTADLSEFNKLNDVVLHEMLHVLGFGSIWTSILDFEGEAITTANLLEDPVFIFNAEGLVTGVTHSNQPKYIGEQGIQAFEELTDIEEEFVPIQGVTVDGKVAFNAVELEGQGSIDAHLDVDTFYNALMTFAFDVEAGEESPLTKVTLASLRDLGYLVNTTIADYYILPTLEKQSGNSKLRGKSTKSLIFRVMFFKLNL